MIWWMLKAAHHWLGAAFGAFLFVIALSGSWLTLAGTMGEAMSNGAFRLTPVTYSAESAAVTIEQITNAYGVESIEEIQFPFPGRAAFLVKRESVPDIYLDQTSLEPIAERRPGAVTNFAYRVHTELLGIFGAGRTTVMWTSLVAIYLAINGLVLLIPSRRSFAPRSILRPKKINYPSTRRAHISTGAIFAVFVIFFGLTGWIVGDPVSAGSVVQSADSAPSQPEAVTLHPQDLSLDRFEGSEWGNAARVIRAVPGRAEGAGEVTLWLTRSDQFSPLTATRLSYAPDSLEILEIEPVMQLGMASKLVTNAAPLHTGFGMGWLYQILISIVGFFIALLAFWALVSYALRWRRRLIVYRNKRHSAPDNG